MRKFKPVLLAIGSVALLTMLITSIYFYRKPSNEMPASTRKMVRNLPLYPTLKRDEISEALGRKRIHSSELQKPYTLTVSGKNYQVKFTLNQELQEKLENVYARYDPAYAAFLAIDPGTGKVLAMVDHTAVGHKENLALQATFPAASVFKVITSAAALEEKKLLPQSRIAFNGSTSTLYKRNLKDNINRWTRFISVEEALAKSVNTVFAKIAIDRLGPQTLQKYANSFGFNQRIDFDMPVDISTVQVPDDMYGLAESGSGFTRKQTLSPLQGALITGSIINSGNMLAPYIIESVTNENGKMVYEASRKTISRPIDSETARTLAVMMENTVTMGTGHKQFRDYNHHPLLSKLFIGAKTGSLSGDNPEGKYDWFVGFAQSSDNPSKKIAFASLIINRRVWKVKASHVAREAILEYFGKQPSL